ncbi:MAG: helix-turn-helix transcriptional regulator [Coriobacteriales bacterium]|nr:helix-turn-helix transcriptional regulator [Coriobacteriales bacterium]MBQ6585943.1 helix-turn-helix transcriptional regulator [Coriobacteriales bacterium]
MAGTEWKLDARIDDLMATPDMMFEELVLDITSEISQIMSEQDVSRSELARRIGCKPPHVTRMLQGGDNFTLRTLTRIAHALQMELRCTMAPMGSVTRFVHTIDGRKESVRVDGQVCTHDRGSLRSKQFGRSVKLSGDDGETLGKVKVG